MAERMDDTKAIKRKFDDETVEQLVENRFVSDKRASHKPKRKAKKKKNYALSALITILAFVLVFVIFFIGSYIVFTASPQTVDEEIKASDTKNEDLAKDYTQEEAPAPTKEKEDKTFDDELTKEDDIDVKPSEKKDDSEAAEKSSAADDDDNEKAASSNAAADTSKKPQAGTKPQSSTTKPQSSATKPQTSAKPQTEPAAKPSAPVTDTEPSSSDVVKKNEDSEAIILD